MPSETDHPVQTDTTRAASRDAETATPCPLCLDGAGMDHNGRYRVLSAMGRDGEFHERLELCPCDCHGEDALDPDGWVEADRRAARHRAANPAPTYATEGEYPTPETEHGKELSARLRNHGLDFDRSIVNIEREARTALEEVKNHE